MRADILDDPRKSDIGKYEGKISFVFVGAFLHLFSWEDQIVALSHIIRLLRPQSGAMVLGRQVGNINPGHYTRKSVPHRNFHHDVRTFKELWMQVEKMTGTAWRVEAEMLDWVGWGKGRNLGLVGKEFEKPDGRDLRFWVERVA